MKQVAQYTYVLEFEAESGAKDDGDYGEPSHGEADVSWNTEEWLLYEGDPHRLDGASDDRVGDKAEGNNKDECPCEDGLHNPSVTSRVNDDGGDPPGEDEEGKTD